MATTASLSPPQDLKPKQEIPDGVKQEAPVASGSGSGSNSSGTLTPLNAASPVKPEPEVDVDGDEDKPYFKAVKVEENKRLYAEEEKKLKDLEPPPAERLQDDWQVAYVWAFIIKFNQKEKIRNLEVLADFERCLTEPLALRPDDVLEGILIQFLKNLRPTLRNTLTAETVQTSLSNYISEQLLNSAEFTVWDRPWASNEEVRGGCCNDQPNRTELGRLRYYGEPVKDRVNKNPIKRIMEQGGGLFELDWRERAKLLRQLVDWQLSHSEVIRAAINIEFKVPAAGAKKDAKAQPEIVTESVKLEPLGQDRNKHRIWSLDSSTRLYRSGNPFKRPCPLIAFTHTRADFDAAIASYQAFGDEPAERPEGKGPKGKLTQAQSNAYKKLVKVKEDEKKLAEQLTELIPKIEREEQRVQRAKKRASAATELAQMAEWRSTRTRRTTRKVDYSYDGVDNDDDDGAYVEAAPVAPAKRRRGEPEFAAGLDDRGRPIIPGERRSARMTAREANSPEPNGDQYDYDEDDDDEALDGNGNGNDHSEPTGSEIESSVQTPAANGTGTGDTASVSNEGKSTTDAIEID